MKRIYCILLIPFLLFYALPTGAAEKEERKWQDETMYYVMVDRFLNGDNTNDYEVNIKDLNAYQGGDFKGVLSQLDYIKDMGFTSIGISPVFDNDEGGYHGYWVTDFYNTEEHFGTLDDFKQLVEEAHKRDLKVVLDFVVNSVGPNHSWFSAPEKSDWIRGEELVANEKDNLNNLNTENPEVQAYILDAAKWWIEQTDIDGYRLDAIQQVTPAFWEEFSREVKSVKDNFYLLGEIDNTDPSSIGKYTDMGIDGFLDYPQSEELRNVFKTYDISTDELPNFWEVNQENYRDPYVMGTFIDNKDMSRFTMFAADENQFPPTRWKQAFTYMYTVPGIPISYYGSEIALNGGESPENRKIMNFKTEKELIDHISLLGELRQKLPALTRGSIETISSNEGMLVYKRQYQDETIIVAINDSSETKSVKVDANLFEEGKELRGLLAGDIVKNDKGEFDIVLDRETSEIYAVADERGLNMGLILSLVTVYVLFILFIYFVRKKSKENKQRDKE
ncbi:alpha-amylase family glycosyl hydrolase [Bacillus spongiae]|uniref:alpha-amylase n=1 Tax=Bacillus spongiae TaxID=2683610 RepID=A0ABU8HB11_9BACI